MTPGLGIEAGPHLWEASALTTAPSIPALQFMQSVSESHYTYKKIIVVFKVMTYRTQRAHISPPHI